MEKKIVIIGAGIAGLSAGCYSRMNGYSVEIYESHALPGGLCTSWKKGEYTIDGCMHWLTGSSPGDSFYKLWQELGAVQGRTFHNHDEFYRFTGSQGKTFIIYCDVDKLEKHMKEISQADAEPIELFCKLIRKFTKFKSSQDKAYELFNFFDIAKMIWSMRSFMKVFNFCSGTTIGEFAGRFKDPFLKETLPMTLGNKDMSLLALVATMALLHNKAGGFPGGGSLEFSRAIEKRLSDMGGKIFYSKKVEKILVNDGKACGVRLVNGTEIFSDYVISCADLHTTVYNMLDGKYIEPQHEELFNTAQILNSSVQVSFGVNMDFSNEPDYVAEAFKLGSPVKIGNVRYTGNYKGTYMSWVMTPDLLKRHRMIKKTLPGLKNFWHSGMWVMAPGGVPTGAKTSRDILQLICRIDNKKFKTTLA